MSQHRRDPPGRPELTRVFTDYRNRRDRRRRAAKSPWTTSTCTARFVEPNADIVKGYQPLMPLAGRPRDRRRDQGAHRLHQDPRIIESAYAPHAGIIIELGKVRIAVLSVVTRRGGVFPRPPGASTGAVSGGGGVSSWPAARRALNQVQERTSTRSCYERATPDSVGARNAAHSSCWRRSCSSARRRLRFLSRLDGDPAGHFDGFLVQRGLHSARSGSRRSPPCPVEWSVRFHR